jgi:NAD(P)-dependent dehydrogenase (short-subunit alcohol dehydrogenase family)
MDLGLDDETVLVTASSSGLGRGCAESLVAEGANVTICGRDAERLAAAESAVADAGPGDVMAIQADVTDPDEVADLVDATVAEYGGLDHLVTSAGGVPPGGFADLSDEQWYGAYDTLVMSVVWTVREAYPHLAESDAGSITCITSTSVRETIDDLLLSNAVRRGVIGLVKSVSREFAPEVRANAVLPGAHETARIEELIEAAIDRGEFADYEAGLADWASEIPLARTGGPRELGDTVAFLASERASFVNGVALPVDGGRLRS